MHISPSKWQGKKVVIMGYGLNENGSGPSAALYMAQQGADVVVTDLRSAEVLSKTIPLLDQYSVKWVLGHHNLADFESADVIVKNPGVHKNSPYLKNAQIIETDLSLFLREMQPPLIAVTGTKGKSSIVSLMHHITTQVHLKHWVGGNITVSPLSFLSQMHPDDLLILELSSWQCGDLASSKLLKPHISIMTNLLPDHQNYYQNDMVDYAQDKAAIFLQQDTHDYAIFNLDDPWTPYFIQKCRAQLAFVSHAPLPQCYSTGAYLYGDTVIIRHQGHEYTIPAHHPAILPINIAFATLALILYGVDAKSCAKHIDSFAGIHHRLEKIRVYHDITYINDSAATMPLATVKAVRHLSQFSPRLHLILGGADKELDFSVWEQILPHIASVHVLDGTAWPKIKTILESCHKTYTGPFDSMFAAVKSATSTSKPGDMVILSPGCASFGLFVNEFDRGQKFVQAVQEL
jgi:UDP-N-acetylmuramoylalanine--D-glutamate ligase